MEESMTHSNTLRVLAVVFVLCLFLSGCVPAVEQPEPAPWFRRPMGATQSFLWRTPQAMICSAF